MPSVQIDWETTIQYECQGEGPYLLLLAGAGHDSRFWQAQTQMLSPYFTIITLDNRGAGQSQTGFSPYTIQDMAEDTAQVLQALSVHLTHVVGHGMGGYVAQELALHYPGYVDRLILASSSFGGSKALPTPPETLAVLRERDKPQEQFVRESMDLLVAPGLIAEDPERYEAIVDYRMQQPVLPEQYQFQILAEIQHSTAERLHRIDIPTLVISGEEDKVCLPGNADLLASTLPNVNLLILPGVGHLFPMEAPELTSKILYDFLTL
jgi:pimeloyl-ACP methyl ester carboxylesterase